MQLQVTDKYYEHVPEMDINIHGTIIMWDVSVITDWTISANWSDIVQHEKKQKTCLLINIAIPDVSNVNTKGTEKLSKYKDLESEVSRMLNMKTKFGPVIIGALGAINKGSYHNLQFLPGPSSATELQNITLMSTAHIINKVLG